MDETGVLNLIEELSMLIEDSKPAPFGKGGLRQVDAQAAFEILDEIATRSLASSLRLVRLFVSVRLFSTRQKPRQAV